VRIGGLRMRNPVMVASGTWGMEYGALLDTRRLGAIVLKTVTLAARRGNPPPRVAETASGMLNSIGLENGGVDDFIKNKLPLYSRAGTAIVASIAGDDRAEFAELARRLSRTGAVDAIELNLSCPNIRYGVREGLIAHSEKATRAVVKAVRASAPGATVIAKLSPNVTDVAAIALAAQQGGADAVALVNTFIGMAVDTGTMRPKLGNVTGGLSGPAIKPLALRAVWEASKKVRIPIIGIGGIMDHEDAVEFMLCGASSVQVGTANFVDPAAPEDIVAGLERYCAKRGIKKVAWLTGKAAAG
jgi:dihydroorotate dehydrogenase (NAD+) catalytic subunit